MISRLWSRVRDFWRDTNIEYRKVKIRRLFREKGWDPTWKEAGDLEYVVYGDRKAYPRPDPLTTMEGKPK